ncbi:ABC transporter substrate-binding protein [Paenibacillus thalictri]|uniref:ABC transporter substrate-binding protein n=1 Tax=Paenibacillus thalictri TaxID=2527873 RepID=A0A4Q9DNV0_9BACL|nr:ABC transporter substrate-binding protein [Paenibacillus thalictri]TBL75645.1 ABC transporter substrate-binding protein [Paenibacillus thalictri]
MKKLAMAATLVTASLVVLAACSNYENIEKGGSAAPKTEAKSGAAAQAPAAEPKKDPWAESAGLYKTEKADELYAKAKGEGKVSVYSTSGRINDVKKSFEKQYPGVTLEIFDLKSNVIMDKLIREQGANIFNADVVLTKEVGGGFKEELVDKGMLFKYLPQDIADHVFEPWKSKGLAYVPYLEFRTLFYNTEQNKTSPVTNWWDLTTPEWKGRVLIADPMQSSDQMDFFAAFVVHADEMAQAYKEKFGKDIVLNGTKNAGYEFIQQFVKNIVLVKSAGDGEDAVGKAAPGKPAPVALGVSGDIRKMEDKKLKADIAWDIKPKTSVVNEAFAFVAKKAPHPNAAKLLIRWMAGETDGKGEGTLPFVEEGSFMTRSDAPNKNKTTIDKINVWQYDSAEFYNVGKDVINFWLKNQ